MIRFLLHILLLLSINLITSNECRAQKDHRAQKLLNKVSKKMKSYKNIYMEFNYSLYQFKNGINHQSTGDILMQGDKYILNFMGTKQIFDEKYTYQILEEDEEINILPKKEDNNLLLPSTLFKFYQKGYQIKWDILQKDSKKTIRYIKLIPMDKNVNIIYILMGINTQNNQLYNIIQINSDQTKITISIKKYIFNQKLNSSTFTFSKSDYPEYMINNVN